MKRQWKCPEVKKTEIRKRENQDISIDFSIENRISDFRFSNFQIHSKSCLQQKVFGVGRCASKPVMTCLGASFPVIFVTLASPEAAPASLRAGMKLGWFCYKSLDSVTCLREPNHINNILFLANISRLEIIYLF